MNGDIEESLDVMGKSFAELRPMLSKFSKYMRQEIDKVFSSQGNGSWEGRSDAAQSKFDASKAAKIAKIEGSKYRSLVGSIRSSKKKAERRLEKATPTIGKLLTKSKWQSYAKSKKALASAQKSTARYADQLGQIDRFVATGDRSGLDKKLVPRVERRDAKAAKKIAALEKGDLLGNIANSFQIDITGTSWSMASRIPWAGVHNEGGTVGHGAVIPARLFLT